MAEKKKMSVAEILAAARAEKGGAAPAKAEPASAADLPGEPAVAVESTQQPAPKPAAATAGGGRPSVADILAMARQKGGAEAAAAKPVSPQPAPAAKPAPVKPAPAKSATAKPVVTGSKTGVQRDTASILAAARAGAKPGPVSKAEAPPRPAKPKPAVAKEAAPQRVVPPPPARPKPAPKPAVEERRTFLSYAVGSFMAVGFTALSITGGLFSLGLARFMFPNVLAEPPSRFKVGFKDGFPSGKVETKFVAQYGVWVVNGDFQGEQQIYALKTVCTHLGCTPNWLEAEQKFKCPCHGSGFYKDGVNFEGPAPRPLERYAIRIADDGQLEVDKSRAFQEELGQWADSSSFVPA